jgi:CDP-paratose 2-epimerase
MNILITGGVGFIGTNAARAFASDPANHITLVDNFSRHGVDINARLLKESFGNIEIVNADIREVNSYLSALKKADAVIHLAGQTAVTTSIKDPVLDFESNVRGGFILLEAIRAHNPDAVVIYSSTNKVYGDLAHHTMVKDEARRRYENADFPEGVDESERLNFISPYGCSKGSMDAYMEDYARMYGLKTVVFRQSCIYGPFQMGVEDQGWVAHFSMQFLKGKPLTLFGDGYQVRDLLFVDDLVDAYTRAIERVDTVAGQAFNIGGGPENSFSLLEVIDILKEKTGTEVDVSLDELRAGDQKYFVSNNGKAASLLGWQPTTRFLDGVVEMISWQKSHLL